MTDEGEQSEPEAEGSKPEPEAKRRRATAMSAAFWRRRPRGVTSVEDVDRELNRAKAANAWTDVRLRRFLGYGSLVILIAQIAVADYLFYIYGRENGWDIPVSAIWVWLVAVVIQAFLLIGVIARYAFPPGGAQDASDRPDMP